MDLNNQYMYEKLKNLSVPLKLGVLAVALIIGFAWGFHEKKARENNGATTQAIEQSVGYIVGSDGKIKEGSVTFGTEDSVDFSGTEAVVDYNTETPTEVVNDIQEVKYTFRTEKNLTEHFEKHGGEFNYANKEEYLAGANKVIASKDALHKNEKEDGDDVYYIEASNEFVIVSTDGFIRTYFKPSGGIDYYNRQ